MSLRTPYAPHILYGDIYAFLFFFSYRDPTLDGLVDAREYVDGLHMEVDFVLIQFISAYDGDMNKFTLAYPGIIDSNISMERIVRACVQHFIKFPDTVYNSEH